MKSPDIRFTALIISALSLSLPLIGWAWSRHRVPPAALARISAPIAPHFPMKPQANL